MNISDLKYLKILLTSAVIEEEICKLLINSKDVDVGRIIYNGILQS